MNYSQLLGMALGERSNSTEAPEPRLSDLSGRFSEDFITLWRTDGWSAYGGGLLWTIDPDETKDTLAGWPKLPVGCAAFARDGFGDLFLLVGKEVHRLDVHRNVLDLVALEVDFFFDLKIHNPRFARDFLEEKRFLAAKRRLGALSAGECYGFVPALALGGTGDLKSIKKLRFAEHLALLAQLHEE